MTAKTGPTALHDGGGSGTSTAVPLVDQGAWVTGHAYAVNDVATYGSTRYVTATAHTSGTFATDLAGGKWVALNFNRLGMFDVRDYGAQIDGRRVIDAATTSGSAIITSATAAFTAADVGKAVQLQTAAGALVATTTVLSYQSATQVTLNANAASTGSGRVLVIGTDDTAAVQAAINAAVSAGGGTVWFPRGICVLAAAQTTGGAGGLAYSGQILFPVRAFNVGQLAVRLLGESPTTEVMWGPAVGDLMPPELTGSVIRSFATTGCVFDVIAAAVVGGNFSNIQVGVENLLLRLANAPSATGFRLDRAVSATFRGVTVGVDASDITGIASPTSTTYGIRMPAVGNAALVEARATQVYGFGTGLQHSEHALLDNLSIYACLVGVEPATAYHVSTYNRVMLQENVTHIKPTGTGANIVGTVGFESKSTGGWWATVWDIDDFNLLLSGSIGYVRYGDGGSRADYCYARTALLLDLWAIPLGGPHSLWPTRTFDGFTRENTTRGLATATSGQVWYPFTAPTGGSSVFGISSNQAYAVGASGNAAQYGAVMWNYHSYPTLTNHTVSTDILTSSGSTQAGLIVRYKDGNNYFFVAITVSGATHKITIQKISGGAYTTVATDVTSNPLANTTYTLSVQCTATQMIVSLNGTVYITYTLTGGEQTTYNPYMRAGLGAFGGGAGAEDGGSRWDNFAVTGVVPASA